MPFAVGRDHRLVRQIDRDLSAWIRSQLVPKFMDDALIERDRKDAVLNAVDLKDFAEAWSDQRAKTIVEHREGGAFTRRAAAEIAIGYEYFRVPVPRFVQDEIRTRLSCFVEAQIIKKRLAVIMSGSPVLAHVAPRQNHSGVDVRKFERDSDRGQNGERLHDVLTSAGARRRDGPRQRPQPPSPNS